MALLRSLILYNGNDALPNVDFTNDTDWQQTEFASMGNLGEAAAGQWLVRDEGGVMPDDSGAKKFIAGHNVVVATVGSNTLFRGRVAAQEQFRGRQKAGRAVEYSITLEDQNSHLRGMIVANWVRPAELDTDRALALVSDYLNGSPRATTVLGTGKIITGSNTIVLPAKTFNGVTPFEVMQELAANTDKEMFVTVDNELAYFGHDYAGYASGLRISDAPGDANATTFAPWEPRGNVVGRQLITALRTYWGTAVTQSNFQVTNTSNEALYDYWEDVFWDNESTTAAQAAARAQKQLDYRGQTDVSYSCAIGPMTGERTAEIKPGQSIQFKARAARAGRSVSGTYLGDSFLNTRVREVRWTMPAEDIYIAHLELERPKRVIPSSVGTPIVTQVTTPVGQGDCFGVAYGWTLADVAAFPNCDAAVNGLDGPPEFVSVSCVSGFSGGAAYFDYTTFLPLVGGVGSLTGSIFLPSAAATQRHEWQVRFGDGPLMFAGGPDYLGGLGFAQRPSSFTGLRLDEGGTPVDLTSILSGIVHYRLRLSGTNLQFRVWADGTPEPTSYQGTTTLSASNPTHIGIDDYWTNDGSSPPAGKTTIHSDIVWCSGAPIAYYGRIYGPVLVAIADGVASSWTLPYPTVYTPGTLDVRVEGVAKQAIEDDPTVGAFSLSFVPTAGDEISAVWWVPAV